MTIEQVAIADRPRKEPFLVKSDRIDIEGFMTVENRLVDDYLHQIGPAGLTVYMMICREQVCAEYPTVQYIKQTTRMNHSTVINALLTLRTVGLLTLHDLSKIGGTEQFNAAIAAQSNNTEYKEE